jgi:hypothetical protein
VHVRVVNESRIGFEYLFPSRHEFLVSDPQALFKATSRESVPISAPYYAVVGVVLALFAFLALRLDDVEATVLGGAVLLFFLFGTVHYYYAGSATLVLFWHRRLRRPGGTAMAALLFLLMGFIYLVWHLFREPALCDSLAASTIYAVYLVAMLFYLFDANFNAAHPARAGTRGRFDIAVGEWLNQSPDRQGAISCARRKSGHENGVDTNSSAFLTRRDRALRR